jgi:hypothetical protein
MCFKHLKAVKYRGCEESTEAKAHHFNFAAVNMGVNSQQTYAMFYLLEAVS